MASRLQLANPYLLVVVGLPGSGKSFFAAQFSDTFHAPYVDFGVYRKVAGEKQGERLALHTLSQLIKTKQTMLIEGRGTTENDRKEIMKLAQKYGYETLFIWVQTEPATTVDRSVHAKGAPLTMDEYKELVKKFENMNRALPHVVISGKHTYASQARAVLKKLIADRPTTSAKPAPARPGRQVIQRLRNRSRE